MSSYSCSASRGAFAPAHDKRLKAAMRGKSHYDPDLSYRNIVLVDHNIHDIYLEYFEKQYIRHVEKLRHGEITGMKEARTARDMKKLIPNIREHEDEPARMIFTRTRTRKQDLKAYENHPTYFDYLKNSKKTKGNVAVEYVFCFGNNGNHPDLEITEALYRSFLQRFEQAFSSRFKIIQAVIHFDETNDLSEKEGVRGTPHMHLSWVPIYRSKSGMEYQYGFGEARSQLGLSEKGKGISSFQKLQDTLMELMEDTLREFGHERHVVGDENRHKDSDLYRQIKQEEEAQIRKEITEDLEKEVREELEVQLAESQTKLEEQKSEIGKNERILDQQENRISQNENQISLDQRRKTALKKQKRSLEEEIGKLQKLRNQELELAGKSQEELLKIKESLQSQIHELSSMLEAISNQILKEYGVPALPADLGPVENDFSKIGSFWNDVDSILESGNPRSGMIPLNTPQGRGIFIPGNLLQEQSKRTHFLIRMLEPFKKLLNRIKSFCVDLIYKKEGLDILRSEDLLWYQQWSSIPRSVLIEHLSKKEMERFDRIQESLKTTPVQDLEQELPL